MKIAIIGSRNLHINELDKFIPKNVQTIVSGGAEGIDTCARDYARKKGLKMIEYFPDYKKYGRSAPLKRNISIIEEADKVLAFWDGKSRGTKFVIDKCKEMNKSVNVIMRKDKINNNMY